MSVTFSPEVVSGIVGDVLKERPVSVKHIPTLEESYVFRIELPSRTVFLKSEHEGHPIDVAAWAYEKAASVGVPVPEVLHLDLSRERWPEEFMIISAVPGSDLQNDPLKGDALAEALTSFGELLRRLHAVDLAGFGDLVFAEGAPEPVGLYADHASHIRACPDWGLGYLVERALVGPAQADEIREIAARQEELFPGPSRGVLLHDDAGLDHVFVERSRLQITGVIDFEPRSGDPAWDLAVFAFHYRELLRHVVEGYGDVPDDFALRCELYGLVRAVGCARWDHERDFDITRPLDEIARRTSYLKSLLR